MEKQMGTLSAIALQDEELDLTLEQQISLHFQTNCYPPIPQEMIPTAIEALDNANSGDWQAMIRLPEGVTFRGYDEVATYHVIDSYYLAHWVIESELEVD
jgi:hypothetical protein